MLCVCIRHVLDVLYCSVHIYVLCVLGVWQGLAGKATYISNVSFHFLYLLSYRGFI